jgi:hypothetical protein
MELLVLGLVATLGVASWALWSRARQARLEPPEKRAPELPAVERAPGTLVPGDIVQHLGADWLVEGVLLVAEEVRGARMSRLVDGARERYLFAAPADADPALLESEPNLHVEGQPDMLTWQGQSYRLKFRSNGTSQRHGNFGGRKVGEKLAFALYTAGAQRVLLVDQAERIDAFSGERVAAHLLEFLPGK